MAYTLTLSKDERAAFDWVGDRYAAGEIARLLVTESTESAPFDREWGDEGDIEFTIPEHVAWSINDLASAEGYYWPCFGEDLRDKMQAFCDNIV